MASWSILPPEIKRHVAKKLDFMSRHSLKSTSHLDRQVVNSTSLKVPRVRFGYKESKCLIVIYTGIEKFLRLELFGCEEGIIIHRFENNFNLVSKKILPSSSTDPLELGISILKSLFAHDSIIINALEWDIRGEINQSDAEKLSNRLLEYLGGAMFRVTEMVLMKNAIENFEETLMDKIISIDDLKATRILSLLISTENLVPIMCQDYDGRAPNGISNYISQLVMENKPFHINAIFDFAFKNLMMIDDALTDNPRLATYRDVTPLGDGAERKKRVVDGQCVNRYYESECGHWIHKMLLKNENRWKDALDSQKCGLGWLCKRCSDSFDYWYHQNLPRRIIYEPFWNDVIWAIDNNFKEKYKELRVKLLEDEKKKKEEKKKNQIENIQNSWGFKKVDSDDVADSESLESPESPESSEVPEFQKDAVDHLVNNISNFVKMLIDVENGVEELRNDGDVVESEDATESLDEDVDDSHEESDEESEEDDVETKEDVTKIEKVNVTGVFQQNSRLFYSAIIGPIILSIGFYLIIAYF